MPSGSATDRLSRVISTPSPMNTRETMPEEPPNAFNPAVATVVFRHVEGRRAAQVQPLLIYLGHRVRVASPLSTPAISPLGRAAGFGDTVTRM
jgi:hypothetical protein